MTATLTERQRVARQTSIASVILATLAWGPAFIGLPHLGTASLLGYLPFRPENYLAFSWLPIGILAIVAAIGWLFRSRDFALLAILIPFTGLAIFLLRFGTDIGRFR